MKQKKMDVKSGGSVNFLWSNYHSYLSDVVRQLHNEECLLDVTLCVEGERIQAHRLVLCSCSSLFQNILSKVTDEHTTIILSDVTSDDVRSIVEFCYNGEIRVPVDNINSLLETAHSLKIFGLMEIPSMNDVGIDDKEETFDQITFVEDMEIIHDDTNDSTESLTEKKVGKRKLTSIDDAEFSEGLKNALSDMSKGMSIIDASTKYQISRSKLYAKAKKCGIALTPTKIDYTIENIRAAIKDVVDGSSLQEAAICHGIPKTVLWRRLQKEGGSAGKMAARKSYLAETREAAVKALERGECLTKVAQEYKIPKTTLFRDKTKLVNEGKLPEHAIKRASADEENKNEALEKAVAACRAGRMSQASASAMYKVPKTTIWRHLHNAKKGQQTMKIRRIDTKEADESSAVKSAVQEPTEDDYSEIEEANEGDLEYIGDEGNISEDQVIILGEGTDGMNMQNSTSLIVVQDTDNNFITCGLELGEVENFTPKS